MANEAAKLRLDAALDDHQGAFDQELARQTANAKFSEDELIKIRREIWLEIIRSDTQLTQLYLTIYGHAP
jgi:hypothetical protein